MTQTSRSVALVSWTSRRRPWPSHVLVAASLVAILSGVSSVAGASSKSTVSSGTATQLVFTQEPAGATGGSSFATQPQVSIEDASDTVVIGDSSLVTLSIEPATGSPSAHLTCTPVNAVDGVATFTGCAIDLAGDSYQLVASAETLTGTSDAFNVSVGAPARLAFLRQPDGAVARVALSTEPTVAVQDAGGNLVASDTSTVSLTLAAHTGTRGTTVTCTPVGAIAGVASFAGCSVDLAGRGVRVVASDGSLHAATSHAFNVAGPSGKGYWVITFDGHISTFGDARAHGTPAGVTSTHPAVALVATPDVKGYWVLLSSGQVDRAGDAHRYGSLRSTNAVAMADTPDGKGYWIATATGKVAHFGDAHGYGSAPKVSFINPVVALGVSAGGAGYWTVQSTGKVDHFGDALALGSPRLRPGDAIVSMATTTDGRGYWLLSADGHVSADGDARNYGGPAGSGGVLSAVLIATPDARGYWIVSDLGKVTPRGDARNFGSLKVAALVTSGASS